MVKQRKNFLWLLWIIITIVALLHLLRAVFDISLRANTTEIPTWVSYIAFILLGYLSYKLLIFLHK